MSNRLATRHPPLNDNIRAWRQNADDLTKPTDAIIAPAPFQIATAWAQALPPALVHLPGKSGPYSRGPNHQTEWHR